MLLVTYFLLKVYSFRLYTLAYNPFQVNFCAQLFFFLSIQIFYPFCHWITLALSLKINWSNICEWFLDSTLSHWSIFPSLHQFHIVFVTATLWQVWKSLRVKSLRFFFFFFKNFLASPSSRLPLRFVNKVLLTYGKTCPLCIFCDCFWTTLVKMNSCNKDSGDWKA